MPSRFRRLPRRRLGKSTLPKGSKYCHTPYLEPMSGNSNQFKIHVCIVMQLLGTFGLDMNESPRSSRSISVACFYPRGSKYRNMMVSVPRGHDGYCTWDPESLYLGNWRLPSPFGGLWRNFSRHLHFQRWTRGLPNFPP